MKDDRNTMPGVCGCARLPLAAAALAGIAGLLGAGCAAPRHLASVGWDRGWKIQDRDPLATLPASFTVSPDTVAERCDGKYYCGLYFDDRYYFLVPDMMSNRRQPCLTLRSCASVVIEASTGRVVRGGAAQSSGKP